MTWQNGGEAREYEGQAHLGLQARYELLKLSAALGLVVGPLLQLDASQATNMCVRIGTTAHTYTKASAAQESDNMLPMTRNTRAHLKRRLLVAVARRQLEVIVQVEVGHAARVLVLVVLVVDGGWW